MTAELSQPTLGLLRRILEGMEPAHAVALPDRKKFWKDQLFDFGFPPRVIEIAVSHEFRWGDIISDLFTGKFGPQNQHFANALPPYFCEQTLKRLLALALHEATDLVLIGQLAESLKREGVEVTWTEKPTAQTTEAQTSGTMWLSDTQREILKTVVSQFLKTSEPTSRILLVKKVVDPDIVDELSPVLLRNPTVEKLFPTAMAFQCCGDKNALEVAKSAVQLVIGTLQKLFASTGEKVHFPIDEIEEQARLILNTQRPELGSTEDRATVQLGLYLVQDFRRVHSGMGGVYPNISHVVVNERIGSTNAATAWNEHIEQYSPYLKNRGEKRSVSNENMKLSAENPVAKSEAVASERNTPMEPFKLITEAIKAVPAVKYALGIGGVIGVIAIVKSFGIDYRVAAFGVVIMLVLMTVLVIFAKLTAKRESVFHWPAIILTWFALILIIATAIALFTSVFWGRPLELRYKGPSSSAEPQVPHAGGTIARQTNATSQGDPSTSGKSTSPVTSAVLPPKIEGKVIGVSANSPEELRKRNNVIRMKETESGKPLTEIPPGSFGFADEIDLTHSLKARLEEMRVEPRATEDRFEVHKLLDGEIELLVYVGPETLEHLRSGSLRGEAVTFFSDKWADASNLVAVPIEGFQCSRVRFVPLDAQVPKHRGLLSALDCKAE